jgi:DNA replication protein DnaC
MRDVTVELKALRLHGMAGAWADLQTQAGPQQLQQGQWLMEHLLQAEGVDRASRSVNYQMHAARFPIHRDLAGFDFEVSVVDRQLVTQLARCEFTEAAHNVVLVGGPGTGKTHLATAIGVAGIAQHGRRVRFYSTVDLVNALEREKTEGKAGRLAASLLRLDLLILDELGYLPFSQAGGALLFHLLSKLRKVWSWRTRRGGRHAPGPASACIDPSARRLPDSATASLRRHVSPTPPRNSPGLSPTSCCPAWRQLTDQ